MQSALFTSPSQESRWLINAAVSNRLLNLQHRGIAPSGLVSSSAAVSNRLLNLQHRGIAPSGLVSSLRRTKTFVSTLLRLHTNLAAHAQSKTINHTDSYSQATIDHQDLKTCFRCRNHCHDYVQHTDDVPMATRFTQQNQRFRPVHGKTKLLRKLVSTLNER